MRKGDPVALVLPNCPQHVVAFYAVLRLGAIVVEHNPLYTPRELRHQFEDHGAKVAIAWDKVVATVQEFPADLAVEHDRLGRPHPRDAAARRAPLLRLPIAKARESRARPDHEGARAPSPWEELLADTRRSRHPSRGPGRGRRRAHPVHERHDRARPRARCSRHRNLRRTPRRRAPGCPTIERGTASVVYAVLPLFHAYGLTLCLTFAMSMGARLVLFPKLRSRPRAAGDQEAPADLPARRAADLRAPDDGRRREGRLADGHPRSPSRARCRCSQAVVEPVGEADRRLPRRGLRPVARCSPVLMANPVAPNRRAGTVGLPLPEHRDPGRRPRRPDERRARPASAGELLVRGPQVFSGYWQQAGRDRRGLRRRLVPHRRHRARSTSDGFVTIVDRIKELIITGGFNVAPTEVEDALRGFPGVADIAVVGIPDARDGEHVVAAVVRGAGRRPSTPTRCAPTRARSSPPYKVPRRVVRRRRAAQVAHRQGAAQEGARGPGRSGVEHRGRR